MEKHKDAEELWRAYSALAGLVAYTVPEHRGHIVPAMNILLSCLRAAGQACGSDYDESRALRTSCEPR